MFVNQVKNSRAKSKGHHRLIHSPCRLLIAGTGY